MKTKLILATMILSSGLFAGGTPHLHSNHNFAPTISHPSYKKEFKEIGDQLQEMSDHLQSQFDAEKEAHEAAAAALDEKVNAKLDAVLDAVGDLDEQVMASEVIQKLLQKIDALERRIVDLEGK